MDGTSVTWAEWAPGNPHERNREDCGVLDSRWRFVDSYCSGSFADPVICQGLPCKKYVISFSSCVANKTKQRWYEL